ncbi:TonB-dependent receptor [Algivirga pacifica]|uniref:TonB-dependent receptor n=2 Tax=Algivirga pacifica TaxID=1162670 RepID=A0ABP9D945_9BACT
MVTLVSFSAFAQSKLISGNVTDAAGEPIVGANVVIKGTTQGTMTDLDGKFNLSIPADISSPVLQIRFIGYESKEITVGNQTSFSIALAEDIEQLEEVVVVGYGIQKKSDLTGSIATVSPEDMNKTAIPNVSQALQGRVAGVNITAASGAPGAGTRVRIRGVGTVNDASPLYVVDGFIVNGSIDHINPNDIKSISVLKDASATAIYGARGANGVILVTTKNGSEGQGTKITYDAYYGVQEAWKAPDMLNSEEYLMVMTKAYENAGSTFNMVAPSNDLGVSTNWFEEVTQVAPMQNHNLSVSGSKEGLNYYLSAGYFDQEGIVKGSNYERLNVRLNGDYQAKDYLRIGTNLTLANAKGKTLPTDFYHGIINAAQKVDPLTPAYDANGLWGSSPYMDINNPVGTIERANNRYSNLRVTGNAYAEVEILKGLKAKSAFSMDLLRNDSYNMEPIFNVSPDENNLRNTVFRGYGATNTWLWENTLSYNKTFDKHTVSALVGYTAQESRFESLGVTRADLLGENEALQYISSATNLEPQVYGSAAEWAMLSTLARVNYSYDDRYLVTANFRRDGSSKFGPENRYGNFMSFSTGWKVINEAFMSDLKGGLLDDLKVRAGWGQIGNDKIGNYEFATAYRSLGRYAYIFGVGGSETSTVGLGPMSIGNTAISWESTETTNLGLDVALLDGRLEANLDYFIRDTKDMLIQEPVPMYIGFNSTTGGTIAPITNLGSVRNKGWEAVLTWKETRGDFSYSVSGNLSSVNNEVLSFGNDLVEFVSSGTFQAGATTRTTPGQPIGAFYGYVVDGIFQNQAEVDAHGQPNARPGDFRYKDINGYDSEGNLVEGPDGVINDADRDFIGSPMPDFTYGLTLNAEYKGFDVSVFFQGVQGNELFNAMKYFNMTGGFPYNKNREILNAWNGEGTSNEVPRLDANDPNNNLRVSSFYIEDGSYLRLKNVQLGYTLPSELVKKAGMQRVRVYASAQNLLTFTNYSGLDPEISGGALSTGLDYGTYPQARTMMFGANIAF